MNVIRVVNSKGQTGEKREEKEEVGFIERERRMRERIKGDSTGRALGSGNLFSAGEAISLGEQGYQTSSLIATPVTGKGFDRPRRKLQLLEANAR